MSTESFTSEPGRVAHRSMGHLGALDGLRGIAIALVFLVHLYAPVFSGGGSGVDLFFVLSGFLITKLALEEHDARGSVSRSDFYLRRAFRILPALLVLMATMLVASFTVLSDVGGVLRREVLFSTFSAGNLWPLFYGFEPRTALAHTWSLGFEEQFYLVWPVILVVALGASIPWRRLSRGVIMFSIASILIGRVVVAGALHYPHWGSIPFFDIDGLALGCLIALFLHHDDAGVSRRLPRWPAVLATFVVAGDLFLARVYEPHDHYNVRVLVLRVAFGYILMYVVAMAPAAASRRLSHPYLKALGRWSYSLYLWHLPVFYMLSNERHPGIPRPALVMLRVFGAFAAALASYYFVERPALAYGRRVRAARAVRLTPRPANVD